MNLTTKIGSFLTCTLALGALALPSAARPTNGTLGGGGTTPGTVDGSGAVAQGTQGIATMWRPKRRFPAAGSPGLWEIRLPGETTPSGFNERFLLQVPTNPSPGNVPLLVAFHRYGNSMYDIPINTQLMAEADARGWYVVAPMMLADDNLNSVPAQMNVEYVINLMKRFYPIDETRIYGIGHSMGGGNVLNYAARHLDPSGAMFAAIVNHTGVTSQKHSFENDCFSTNCFLQPLWEFWYGGSPATNPFDYARSSVIDLDYQVGMPAIPVADTTNDMARNLTHIPMQSWMADQDPLYELVVQNIAFDAQMQARGGDHTLITRPVNDHLWDTMDYVQALDFLASKTLTLPDSAETLADRDGRFFHFGVTQTVADEFTPFTWDLDSVTGRLEIRETANLEILDVDLYSASLSTRPGSVITVSVSTMDGTPDLVRLNGAAAAPVSVTRDGNVVTSWTYDALQQSVEFQDADGATHEWTFTF